MSVANRSVSSPFVKVLFASRDTEVEKVNEGKTATASLVYVYFH